MKDDDYSGFAFIWWIKEDVLCPERMSSVLNLSGLNYQRSNPLRREILALQADITKLKEAVVMLSQGGAATAAATPVVGPPGPAGPPGPTGPPGPAGPLPPRPFNLIFAPSFIPPGILVVTELAFPP